MRDPKTDITPLHALTGGIFTTTQSGATIDMARHDYLLIQIGIVAVQTQPATIRIQDSADGSSWANVASQSFSEPVTVTATTRHVFVRERDVRRYVRVQMVPNGGTTTLAGTAVLLNASSPPIESTYSIDTSA